MNNKLNEKKFTVAEAAEILSLHPASLRRKMADKSLGFYRFSTKILIGESHLEEFVERAESKPRETNIKGG